MRNHILLAMGLSLTVACADEGDEAPGPGVSPIEGGQVRAILSGSGASYHACDEQYPNLRLADLYSASGFVVETDDAIVHLGESTNAIRTRDARWPEWRLACGPSPCLP